MTRKQIDQVRKELRKKTYKDWTDAEKMIDRELYCREMINSCLIYGSASYYFYNKESEQFGHYATNYVRELGEKRVKELFEEQCADFAKATVYRNVYTDSEGCTYNSCKWEDD